MWTLKITTTTSFILLLQWQQSLQFPAHLTTVRANLWNLQFSSVAQSCLTLCNPMDCSTPGFPVHHQLPEPTQTHVHWVGDAIQPSHPLSFPSPPAFNLSQHQGLPIRWPKYWSFRVTPSNEYSGLISFRIDWFDLLVNIGMISIRSTLAAFSVLVERPLLIQQKCL